MKKIMIEYDDESDLVEVIFLHKDIMARGGFSSIFLELENSFKDQLMKELINVLNEGLKNEKN